MFKPLYFLLKIGKLSNKQTTPATKELYKRNKIIKVYFPPNILKLSWPQASHPKLIEKDGYLPSARGVYNNTREKAKNNIIDYKNLFQQNKRAVRIPYPFKKRICKRKKGKEKNERAKINSIVNC